MHIIFDLPFFNPTVGGVVETIKLARQMKADINFQNVTMWNKCNHPLLEGMNVTFSGGTNLKCDVCITYSDNPFTFNLVHNKNIGKVMVYMLSYGMSIDRERANVSNAKVIPMCSTKKIEKAIRNDGFEVNRVGFALDMDIMHDLKQERDEICAIYYHPMPSKRYELAVEVADALYAMNNTNGTISFGTSERYSTANKPYGLIRHYQDATREQVRELFNHSKIYVSTSNSEGLNLTPIEATLCGCPTVVCDGAIDEIFINGETCFVPESQSYFDVYNDALELLSSYDIYAEMFRKNMAKIIEQYTYENVIGNIKDLL